MQLQYELEAGPTSDDFAYASNGEAIPLPQEVVEGLPALIPTQKDVADEFIVPASTAIADSIRSLLLLVPGNAEAKREEDGTLHLILKLDEETLNKAEGALCSLAKYQREADLPAPPPTLPPVPTAQVLIVDDDPIFRLLLRRILQQIPECGIVEAKSGQEALAILETGQVPDLCISDISMPEMDGLQLLQRIRSMPALVQMNVILCTSTTERNTVVKAAGLNVSRYLVKPFQPVVVREQVRELLSQIIAKRSQQWLELQERLGLSAEFCVELVGQLASQVRETVLAVRGLLSHAKNHAARVRVNSLKGAASMLSDQALNTAIQKLYDRLEASNLSDSIDSLDNLEIEGKRIGMMADKLALLLTSPPHAPS
jgi:two-component system chemotaxis response regulator CheY